MSRIGTRIIAACSALVLCSSLALPAAAAPAIGWAGCPANSRVPAGAPPLADYQCATVDMPMSYRDPDGAKIQVAIGKLPAVDQAHKIGTVFTNPGGPGTPGRIPQVLTPELHQRYDIIGFDPRGVGASTPLRCFTDPQQTQLLAGAFGQFPVNRTQQVKQIQDVKSVDGLCGSNGGPLLAHLSSANIARDLDRLRAMVGEQRLSYYGLSYGTFLGETYANLFPQRVGALAFDAVDDPVAFATGRPGQLGEPASYRLGEEVGAQQSLNSFLSACAADSRCVFRGDGVNLAGRYRAILSALQKSPITITDPQSGKPKSINYQGFIGQLHSMLTDAANSPAIAALLHALENPLPSTKLAASPPPPVATDYDSLLGGGGTLCSDTANPRDPFVWQHFADKADSRVPGFGSFVTYITLPCSAWPTGDADHYSGPWNRPTANPILLIANNQGDPETPYPGAQRAQRELANARLLSVNTFGHGSIGRSNCVDTALNNYFFQRQLPEPGTICQPNHQPFDPAR